jgi:acyl-[acyl-carrier-protein] desaturase
MRAMRHLSDADLLRELEPTAAASLERHLAVAPAWLPHEWVPWSRGRDFTGEGGLAWAPDQSALPEGARAAFELNLLTEDNLPSYHHELLSRLGQEGAWGAWVRRWTAEEARHAASIRDYLIVSRAVDPAALERERMVTMQAGWTAGGKDVLRSLVYVTFQELATRIAHRNTGRAADDPVAERLLAHIAADENLHMVFYRDLIAAALALAPEQAVVAVAAEAAGFQMPGAGVPGFLRKSVLIAHAGIYDVRLHRDEVVAPLVRQWRVLALPVTTDAARRAQDDLARHLDRLEEMARRYEARRARRDVPGTPSGPTT